jgi:crotonobetainyl-CoA:carnitine CoA-transferase CaiB-like acyl-CoA transferase
MERTKKEIWESGQPYRVVSAPLNTTADLVSDSHLTSRGLFTDIGHPVTGKVKYLGRPFIMGRTPWSIRRPAPLLGQHNREIYGTLGYTNEDLVELRQAGVI